MCAGPFRPSKPPPPPADEIGREKRVRERAAAQREKAELIQKTLEQRVATLTGKRKRRSLLTGRKGGQGFAVAPELMSKQTLGT